MALTRNVNDWERLASVAAGAALVAMAIGRRRGGAGRIAAGAGLMARGVSGFCPVNYAVGRHRRLDDTREALGGPRGVHLTDHVIIARPIDEVFAFWRALENLPKFMPHIEAITPIDDRRSHWVMRGPAGARVEWDAEIHNEIRNELIGWRSLPGADVASAGSVRFRPLGERGTAVDVTMQYAPPAGRLGASIATLLGASPASALHTDLQRLKQMLELGADDLHQPTPGMWPDLGTARPM